MMKAHFNPQPFTAVVLATIALCDLMVLWQARPSLAIDSATPSSVLLAIFLAATIVGAGLRPVHVRHNFKIILTTVPLYVAAMLLPPLLAALTAGVSTLAVQLLTQAQRHNTPSDIATATTRWFIAGLASATLAEWAITRQIPMPVVLLGSAAMMFGCDIVLGALEIAPMSGESPRRIMAILLREAGLSEGAQYLLAILATLAAQQQAWSLILWLPPLCVVYWSLRQAKEMHDGTSRLLESLADTVDLRDPYTGGHSRRVTEYAMQILRAMGKIGPEVELIRTAARVHDIGKIGIPDEILNKPGWLTSEERAIMNSHPDRGADLLARYQDFARGCAIVRHHHERWDGAGYPAGLKSLDIPFGARVIAVADSFDAMTSDRPYRKGMPTEQALRILHEDRGQQWDPAIVDAFLRAIGHENPAPVAAEDTISVASTAV